MTAPVLAIDFGTFASSARLVSGSKIEDYVPDPGRSQEERSWRSVVYWDGVHLHVGEAAWKQRTSEPHRYREEFKPLLRERRPVVLGGSGGFRPEDLVMRFLAKMREAADAKYRTEVKRAVIAVPPAYFEPGDHRAELMLEAADLAGFTERVELIAEPVAAALAEPSGGPFEQGSWVLVYDFGGGTFDAAVVRVGDDGTRIPARSIDDCGGMRIDAAIEQWLCEHGPPGIAALLEMDTADDDDLSAARGLIRLREFCEELKLSLTNPSLEWVKLRFELLGQDITMKAEDLDECTAGPLDQTVSCCRELLRDANIESAELAAILLVGGSSRLRGVREKLSSAFSGPGRDIDIRSAVRPTLAVVDGTARFAARMSERVIRRSVKDPRMRAIRWDIPGDHATVVRWHVREGSQYSRDQELAEVRLRTGEIYRLADDEGGTVRTRHAAEDQPVRSGDWLLTSWLPFAKPWHRQLAASDVSPAVSGWTVFVGTRSGTVCALATATGEVRWESPSLGAEVTSPPAIRHGLIYVGCRDGSMHALDEQTGQPAAQSFSVGEAVTSAPMLIGQRTWAATGSGFLYGISPDGARKEFAILPGLYPVYSNGVIWVRGQGNALYGIDAVNATPVPGWNYRFEDGHGQHGVHGGAVYEYCGGDGIRKLSVWTGESMAEQVLPPEEHQETLTGGRRPAPADVFRQVRKGAKRVQGVIAGAEPLLGTVPVFAQGAGGRETVYAGTADGRLIAFDAGTLEPYDQAKLSQSPLRSLSRASGTLYAGAADKKFYVLGTRPGLPVLASYPAGGTVTAEPVAGYGGVYLTTGDGVLRAFPSHAEGQSDD